MDNVSEADERKALEEAWRKADRDNGIFRAAGAWELALSFGRSVPEVVLPLPGTDWQEQERGRTLFASSMLLPLFGAAEYEGKGGGMDA